MAYDDLADIAELLEQTERGVEVAPLDLVPARQRGDALEALLGEQVEAAILSTGEKSGQSAGRFRSELTAQLLAAVRRKPAEIGAVDVLFNCAGFVAAA